MQPLALDLSSFSADVSSGHLPSADWARAARDCGVHALDLPLDWLLRLNPESDGPLLREELERQGVVIAAVRDERICQLTAGSNLSSGVPLWPARWGSICSSLYSAHWNVHAIILRPPATDAMGLFNKVVVNLVRARHIAAEWGLRLAISNEMTQQYQSILHDARGLSLALDLERLPSESTARERALDAALPHARLLRAAADGSADDVRRLAAWRNLLDAARFGGWVSVRYTGEGDRYSGAGTAITLLRGTETPEGRPERPSGTTPPPHRDP